MKCPYCKRELQTTDEWYETNHEETSVMFHVSYYCRDCDRVFEAENIFKFSHCQDMREVDPRTDEIKKFFGKIVAFRAERDLLQ